LDRILLQKDFAQSERARMIHRAPMRNVDSKIQSSHSMLRIFIRKPLLVDFCNNIARSADRAGVRHAVSIVITP
jgi:hypothetical protein